MSRTSLVNFVFGLFLLLVCTSDSPSTIIRLRPKLEPVAETKLLMEGLAQANLRGLERILTKKPDDAEAWVFARGQALLVAETGNLLLIRPPKNRGERDWMNHAIEMRDNATQLAQALAKRDYDGSKRRLSQLATSCNACHSTFRVNTKVELSADPKRSIP